METDGSFQRRLVREGAMLRSLLLCTLALVLGFVSIARSPSMILTQTPELTFKQQIIVQPDSVIRAVMKLGALCRPSGEEHDPSAESDCPLCSLCMGFVISPAQKRHLSNQLGSNLWILSQRWHRTGVLWRLYPPRAPPA